MEPDPAKPYKPSLGFVACLTSIVIFLLVISLPFSYSQNDRDRAKARSCASNMRQIGLGMLQYMQDNDEQFPARQYTGKDRDTVTWRVAVYPYIKSTQIFRCPSNPVAAKPAAISSQKIEDSDFARSYAANSTSDDAGCFGPFSGKFPKGFPFAMADSPSSLALVVESTAAYCDFNVLEPNIFRHPTNPHSLTGYLYCGHKSMTNVLFCDGHVKPKKPTDLLGTAAFGGNPWTTDGAPFSAADQAKATSVIEYSAKQYQ
jgi:prepilin-type processing-associated H-X9-DG protein